MFFDIAPKMWLSGLKGGSWVCCWKLGGSGTLSLPTDELEIRPIEFSL